MQKFILALIFLISTQEAMASRFMTPYTDFTMKGDNLVLNSINLDKNQVVVFYNTSKTSLILNRVLVDNPGVSAGWASQLDPKRWSALSWQGGDFKLSCQSSVEQHWVSVPCNQVLKLYQGNQYLNPKPGSYWLFENKTRPRLFR